jgi:hypothetical protein
MLPPIANPRTEPPANIELIIPWLIASFSLGKCSLTSPKVTGNTEIPIPCKILDISNIKKFEDKGEMARPIV